MRVDNVAIQENYRLDHHGTCVEFLFLDKRMSQEIRSLRHNDYLDYYHRDNDLIQQAM